MNRTKIEWVKNPDGSQGYTWNPITGCLNHVNGLCKGGGFPCYAYKLAQTRLKERYLANHNIANWETLSDVEKVQAYNDPFYPRFWEEKLGELDRWGYDSKPHGVFVCDMGDLFGIGVPEEWTRRILGAIDEQLMRPNKDRFYLLTKQPQNLMKFSPFPDNAWVGVTATNSSMFRDAIFYLGNVKATIKYISFEPLLTSANEPDQPQEAGELDYNFSLNVVNWLVIGQQTPVSAKTQPKIEWVREIVEAADRVGVPVFLKDNLRPLIGEHLGHTFPGFAYREQLRQELPGVVAMIPQKG